MRTFAAVSALVALATAQSTLTGPPMGVYKTVNNEKAVTATTLSDVAQATGVQKRDVSDLLSTNGPPMGVYKTANYEKAVTATTLTNAIATAAGAAKVKRDDTCVAQPTGIGYVSSPDAPDAFQQDSYLGNVSTSAVTPAGYTNIFTDIVAANSADNYMGFTFLNNYDVAACAAQCSSIAGCASFNIYFERDPSVNPDVNACPNPPSVTRVKCVWWGGLVSLNNANNYGQQLASFYVVITGSSGYANTSAAAAINAAAANPTTSASGAVVTAVSNVGSGYTIYYSSDSSTGSFSNGQATSSYADCMDLCDQTLSCQAFTYVGGANGIGSGTCWLKTSLGSPSASSSGFVSGSKNAVSAGSSVNAAATTAQASSSVVAVAASSAAASSAAASSSTSTSSTTAVTYNLLRPTYGDGSSTTAAAVSVVTVSSVSYSAPAAVSTSTSTPAATQASVPASTPASSVAPTTVLVANKYGSASATTTVAPVTTSAAPITTSAAPATTLATSVKTSSTTTTSAAASSSTPFYIKIGNNGNSNTYAYVNWLMGGKVTFVSGTRYATKFYIDANGKLLNKDILSFLSGYGANVQSNGGKWQRTGFNWLSSRVDFAKCWLQDGYVQCNNSGGFVYAGTCSNDGFLYFGSPNQVPGNCGWTGMYPVSA